MTQSHFSIPILKKCFYFSHIAKTEWLEGRIGRRFLKGVLVVGPLKIENPKSHQAKWLDFTSLKHDVSLAFEEWVLQVFEVCRLKCKLTVETSWPPGACQAWRFILAVWQGFPMTFRSDGAAVLACGYRLDWLCSHLYKMRVSSLLTRRGGSLPCNEDGGPVGAFPPLAGETATCLEFNYYPSPPSFCSCAAWGLLFTWSLFSG